MKVTFASALTALALVCAPFSAQAADKVLTISSWAPPTHGMNASMWPKAIAMMEEATNGRVSGELKFGLGSPPAQFDLILDGVADIGWIYHGYTPGRFVSTKMIELPGYTGSAETASIASWRAYNKYFAGLNEHKGVKVLAMMTHGPGFLHTKSKVTSLDQISGLKLRIGGGVAGDVGTALGATGIRVPAPKVYETLASNAADGVMMPMDGQKAFKLTEVAPNTLTVPGGFYRGSFAIIMNQDTFDGLSAQDQQALEQVFGETLSRVAGQAWDQVDRDGDAAVAASPDSTMNAASAADTKRWQAISETLIAQVLKEVSDKGVDAKAAHAFIQEQMSAQ